jgi:type I restriction enzyme S subunit
MTASRGKTIHGTKESITEAGLNNSGTRLLPIGSVIVTTRASIGMVGVAGCPLTTNQGFKSVVPTQDVHPGFLYHLLGTLTHELYRRASGTTFQEISGREFKEIRVPSPPVEEQARIAEVLDTLDEAIRESEAIRWKRSQLLEGLAQQMLACGVDEDGRIRDSNLSPDSFTRTPLGRFPRSWQIKRISDLGTTVTGSTPPSSVPGVWGDGIPFVTPSEVTEGGAVLTASRSVTDKGKAYISPLPRGTLLTVCIGSTLGKMALTQQVCATNQQINATIPGSGVDGTFLEYAIRLQMGRLLALAGLQAVPIVNRTQFEGLKVAVAPPDEQGRIGDILRAQQALIREEETVLSRLKAVKSGLSADLLTGRVRTLSH